MYSDQEEEEDYAMELEGGRSTHDNSNNNDEEEDEDIIAIHEQSYHDSFLPPQMLLEDESQQCLSLTEQPRLPSPNTIQERNRRRLLRRGGGKRHQQNSDHQHNNNPLLRLATAGNDNNVASNNKMNNNDLLDASTGFASLQSLLEAQPLSLSLTQETTTDKNQDEEMMRVVEERGDDDEQSMDPKNPSEFLDDTEAKENAGAPKMPGRETNKGTDQGNKIIDQYSRLDEPENTANDATTLIIPPMMAQSPQPIRHTQDLGFTPLFQEEEEDEQPHEIWHQQSQQTHSVQQKPPSTTGIERELERERERRKSNSNKIMEDRPPIKKHRKREASTRKKAATTTMVEETEPTHSIRRSMQRQREKNHSKKNRSKSADTVRPEQQSRNRHHKKKSGRTRSASPKRSVVVSPKQKQQQQQPIPMEKVETSLIGLRPSHWGTSKPKGRRGPLSRLEGSGYNDNKRRNNNNSSSRDLDERERQRQKLAAAADTKTYSKLMPPPPPRKNNNSPPSFGHNRHQWPMDSTGTTANTTMSTTANISFRQDFLPSGTNPSSSQEGPSTTEDMDIEEDPMAFAEPSGLNNDEGDMGATSFGGTTRTMSRVAQGVNQHHHYNNKKRRASGGKTEFGGVLTSLLKEIRSESSNHRTRLRSGEYPFPNKVTSRFDLFDPRNRAYSYMDVTIVGDIDTGIPWKDARFSLQNRMVVGYIHKHHVYPERDVLASASATENKPPADHSLAWICFSRDRHIELQHGPQGMQLRIYNAVLQPCTAGRCKFTVLCTDLFERYPSGVLDPLQPALPAILSQMEVNTTT